MSDEAPAKQAAEAEAEKRNRHKAPTLIHKEWAAVHDSVKGWHVALVDDRRYIARQAVQEATRKEQAAREAFMAGDLHGFLDAAGDALLAKCRAATAFADPPAPSPKEINRDD